MVSPKMKISHFALAFLLLLPLTPSANAKGINCELASNVVEKTVCASPELLKFDAALSDTYSDISSRLAPPYADKLKSSQAHWVREITKKCGSSKMNESERFECVKQEYIGRKGELIGPTGERTSCAAQPQSNQWRINKKIYCENSEIAESKRKMDDAFLNLQWSLPLNLAKMFGDAHGVWISMTLDEKCGVSSKGPNSKDHVLSPEQETAATNCVISEMQNRADLFTRELSSTTQNEHEKNHPYQLSALEIFILNQIYESKYDYLSGGLLDIYYTDTLAKRLISSIISGPSEDMDFAMNSRNGDVLYMNLLEGRYFIQIGQNRIYSDDLIRATYDPDLLAIVADLKTGDVIFARADATRSMVYEKACTNDDLKAFIRSGIDLQFGSDGNFSTFEVANPEIRATVCQ